MAPLPSPRDRVTHLPRRIRRPLVIATFIGYPLLVVGYATSLDAGLVPSFAWTPIALVFLVGLELGGLAILHRYTGGRTDPNDARLDERERALATRALATSYGVLATTVVGIVVTAALWIAFVEPIVLGPGLLLVAAVMVGVYLPVMPAAVLAWIAPDAAPDDDPTSISAWPAPETDDPGLGH